MYHQKLIFKNVSYFHEECIKRKKNIKSMLQRMSSSYAPIEQTYIGYSLSGGMMKNDEKRWRKKV